MYSDKTTMSDDYYIEIGKNISKLIDATEIYTTFMYFLKETREYEELSLKIGTFEYDDWICDLFCHLSKSKIYFTEKNHSCSIQSNKKYKTLTDLCFGFSFNEAKINIKYSTINNFLNIVTKEDECIFEEMLSEVHCDFW